MYRLPTVILNHYFNRKNKSNKERKKERKKEWNKERTKEGKKERKKNDCTLKGKLWQNVLFFGVNMTCDKGKSGKWFENVWTIKNHQRNGKALLKNKLY